MARIKFLDVLEETKTKPSYNPVSNHTSNDSFTTVSHKKEVRNPISTEQSFRRERSKFSEDAPRESLSSLRERSLLKDSNLSFEGAGTSRQHVERTHIMKNSSSMNLEDNKILLTGALFVLFGGMLFLSGYWFGKNINQNVKSDRDIFMNQSLNDLKSNDYSANNSSAAPSLPMTSTVDTIPVPQKPIPVVTPATATSSAPKSAKPKTSAPAAKEYIIQVSAHSTIDAARIVEEQLRRSDFSAYISESVIGDSVFFRVRIRGFNNKKDAQDMLSKIKNQNMGQDGFVLTLE